MMLRNSGLLEREVRVAEQAMEDRELVHEAERIVAAPNHVEAGRPRAERYLWGTLRIMMGWIFMWPFLDKLFGLGFATEKGQGWIDGASPTFGYLTFATKGPFAGMYQGMADSVIVEWAFMLGLAAIGTALLLGVMVRIAAAGGVAMLLMMYTAAAIWPEHNPFLDDHIVYAAILVGIALTGAGRYMGLGGWWMETRLARRYRFLR